MTLLRGCAFVIGGFALRATLFVAGAMLFDGLARTRKGWRRRKVQARPSARHQRRHDLGWSLSTVAIFSAFSILTVVGHWTRIYYEVAERGWPYLFASVLALVLLHDTYFYWMHRLLHLPWLFRRVHAVHHRSTNPTVWTGLAFHPCEALLEGAIIPLGVALIPLHPLAVGIFVATVSGVNIEGHCGYEFRPRGFANHPLWRWNAGSTYHNDHHRLARGHYGFYFTFWDRLMGTHELDLP